MKEYNIAFYKQTHIRGKILAIDDNDLEEKMKSNNSIMENLIIFEEKEMEVDYFTIDEVKESEYYE